MAFPPNSRYQDTPITQYEQPDGSSIPYLRRRFLPQSDQLIVLQEHSVVAGDRIDNLAARYLGDPEQYWRICDANRALSPSALTSRIGARLRITLAEGMQGVSLV